MRTPEKQRVIDSINKLGRRVTAADVSTSTGLPLGQATLLLNTVAAETHGHLEVASTGDVAYKFSPGFQSAYLATGLKKTLQEIGKTIFNAAYFLLRISFGIMLILSLIVVVALILIIILRTGGRDNDRDGGGFSFDFFDYLILRDFFTWTVYSTYDPYPTRGYARPKRKNNFLLNCFSFLFGDGNPNANIEERKWQQIAETIKRFNGVVTAEQLAPYTGEDPRRDDCVLPVLVRFNGRPEVTEKGNIVYVFPELQVTASGIVEPSRSFGITEELYLREWKWPFSNVSAGSLTPVYLLAGANFLGAWWVYGQLARLPEFLPLVSALTIYGTLFVGVPLIRYFVLQWMNSGIESRNKKRESYAQVLANPSEEILRKLGEAASYKVKEQRIREDQIVYSTEKSAMEQKDALDEQFEKLEAQSEEPASEIEKSPKKEHKRIEQSSIDEGEVINVKSPHEEFDASP